MILHIDMDAFFASIEQAINPRLKGKPLIVGSRPSRLHTVVCAASYEAKAFGIGSGMSSKEAFSLCPNLEFVAADQSKYIWTSQQILAMLKGYGLPLVYASIDEFRMDIPDEANAYLLAKDIQAKIQADFRITASIGIAKNCLLGKLASEINKPNGIAIFTAENLIETLAKLPVEKLCGVGAKTALLFAGLGINTCLDLYQKTPGFLEQRLGKNGLELYISLHSQESLTAYLDTDTPKSIGHSYTLPRSSENPGFIRAWLRLLAEMVGQRLRQNNLVSNTVHLWLNAPQGANFGAQKTFTVATNDGYEIYQRGLKIMAKIGPRMPQIRALGITCSKLTQDDYQPLLEEQKRREALIKAMDRINQKLGDHCIYPAIVNLTQKTR